jgi:pimeloyl-ACP methyl ester carboxylesterase
MHSRHRYAEGMTLRLSGALFAAALLLVSLPGLAQSKRIETPLPTNGVPANTLIPSPVPSAPLSDWTQGDRRFPVEMITDGGVHLRGWDFKPAVERKNAPLVLFFNGNGMTIDRSQPLYRALANGLDGRMPVGDSTQQAIAAAEIPMGTQRSSDRMSGTEVVVYDYRGYGFSEGTPDVSTFRRDALAEYDRIAKQYPTRQIVVYGFSLGTAMATKVAADRHVGGLILAGSIASAAAEFPVYARAQGYTAAQIEGARPAQDAIEAFDEIGLMQRITAPLLMLHGEADTLVPIVEGRDLFKAARMKDKRFVALPGVGHSQTVVSPLAFAAVAAFLEKR